MPKFCREPVDLELLSAILILVEVQQSWSHTGCAQTSSDVQWLRAALRSTHAVRFSLSWMQERKDELATPWHLSLISTPSEMISTTLTKEGMLQIEAIRHSCKHRYPCWSGFLVVRHAQALKAWTCLRCRAYSYCAHFTVFI